MPLDEFLPQFDFNEAHSTLVAASPERTLAAARELTPRHVPLMAALTALRRLTLNRSTDPIVDQMLRSGFVLLADRPEELVLGVAGRFWTPSGGIARIGAGEFAGFRAPNHARAVIDFHVQPAPGGCLLSTETRIQATDEQARRSFGRYWRIVRPGSALIRRVWLRAARRRAERG